MTEKEINTIGGCQMITTPVFTDERGTLTFAESEGKIPFCIQRIFWIYGVEKGKTRGGHSHNVCAQAIFAMHGSFDIDISDGKTMCTLHLDSPANGILIPAQVWSELKNFTDDAVCMVACSHHFDAEDYISDYQEYLEQCK